MRLFQLSAMALLPLLCLSSARADSVPNTLSFEVRLSTRELRLGESVIISGVIRNNSSETVYFHKPSELAMGQIDVYSPEGKRQPEFSKNYAADPLPFSITTMNQMAEIRPGGEFVFEFSAELLRESIPNYQRQGYPEIDGVFLDSGLSGILIEHAGTFGIKIDLRRYKEDSEQEEKVLGIKNVWHGRLVSEPVSLKIYF
jgi:hypothetical protein